MGLYKLSFKNLRRRKLRSILTMLGIVIGVTTLVLLVGLGAGMTSSIKEQTESMMGDVIITKSGSGEMAAMGPVGTMQNQMDPDTVSKIKNNSLLFDIKEYVTFIDVVNGMTVVVEGTNDWQQVKMKNGTAGVVIDEEVANQLGLKVGSKFKLKDQEFTVTGIAANTGGMIYIEIDKVRNMTENKISTISARTRGDPKLVSKEIENQISGVDVLTKSDIAEEVDKLTSQMLLFIGGIASIGLIVGVISIVNTMLISVMERTREIGILKAIGFTNREILGSTLMEAGLLGFIGSIVGVIIGAIGIVLLSNTFGIENVSNLLPLWLILGVIGGATFLSILAGLYPAWRASRLNVVEALRNE
ncbi:MAG: ABC transporter permease [Euryarchaeota archaeon]|nr:ABC transporter permease [Euryarchaeota archaeon]